MRGTLAAVRLTPAVIGLYAITSAIAVLASPAVPWPVRAPVSAIVTGIAVLAAFASRRAVRGPGSLALAALAVGAVRGVALLACLDFSAVDRSHDPLRVASSAVSALIWIGAFAMALASREAYRARYAAAVRQVALARAPEALEALPEVSSVQDALARAADASARELDGRQLREAAAILRGEIEERIRPLSHRMWFAAASAEAPRARLGPLVRDAVLTFAVPIWPVTAIWLVSTLIGAPVLYGTVRGLASAAACSGFLAGALVLSRWALERTQSRWAGPAALVACAVAPVLLTQLLVSSTGIAATGTAAVATYTFVPLALGGLLLAASAASLAGADRRLVLGLAESRADAVPASRELSSYLHNTVQSELASLAMQLDRAEPGSAEAQRAVERLAALASRSIADGFRAQRESPLARMHAGAASWRGIAEVSVEVDAGVDEADPRMPVLVQAAEEATSNAVRHGRARTVTVRVRTDGGALALEVASDGSLGGPEGAGNGAGAGGTGTGMGQGWLASVAAAPVELVERDGGTVLRLVL